VSEVYAKAEAERLALEVAGAAWALAAPDKQCDATALVALTSRILASLTPVRLPVIETCGACPAQWTKKRPWGWETRCHHSQAPRDRDGGVLRVDRFAAPPSTCPLLPRRPR